MKIFSIISKYDEYKSYVPKDWNEATNHFSSLRCKGKKMEWPKPLEIIGDNEDTGMPEPDIGIINIGSLVLSTGALIYLRKIVSKYGQLLPLNYGDQKMYLWNITNIIDALDKEKSEMNDFGGVSKITFSKKKILDSKIFKIREDNATNIFCTQEFVDIVLGNNLSGIEFEEQTTN